MGLTGEWYSFYEYLDLHRAVPYVDVREGYPPLGFLVYMPLYSLSKGNPALFYQLFRLVNGILLTLTVQTLYFVAKHTVGKRRALRHALYYGLLPSVVIANTYSNDIISLLPASLSIYAMLERKPSLCGLMIGLASLGKGFPALLLIPALFYFEEVGEKVKLAGLAILTFIYVSLPFLILNPFTYVSTFTHHASRGPWETIWALIEGYYSHGGLLHPYFDKFFYHEHLLALYEANPYDHAVYRWKYSFLPTFLTLAQIASILAVALTLYGRKLKPKKLTASCGIFYIAYILFFKGYSTQFAVSTSYYALLAVVDSPLKFLVPLEIGHTLQILAWNAQAIALTLRNFHIEMLISAVAVRTLILSYIVIRYLAENHPNSRTLISLIKSLLHHFYNITSKDKLLPILTVITLLSSLPALTQAYSYLQNRNLRILNGVIEASTKTWSLIHLEGLSKGDQVIAKFETNTWLDFNVSDIPSSELERGLVNPYNLKGSFYQTLIFFRAKSYAHEIWLKMKHPKIPFRVTDGLDGDLTCSVECENSTITIELYDKGLDGSNSMFRIAYPYITHVEDKLKLPFVYTIAGDPPSSILLDVFDDRDEWVYAIKPVGNLSLHPVIKGEDHPYILGDDISLIALVVSLKDGASTTIRLEEPRFNVENSVKIYAKTVEKISYTILIEKDFQPTPEYEISLLTSIILLTALASRMYSSSVRLRNPSIVEEFRP